MRRPIILLLAASLGLPSIGCTLDLSGISGRSTRPPDASARDATVDRGDAEPPAGDAGPPIGGDDAGPPRADAGPGVDSGFDAGFDAGPPGTDAGYRRPCDAIYGSIDGYHACSEEVTECRFFRGDSQPRSCDSICASRGGSCVRAAQEQLFSRCSEAFGVGCDLPSYTSICTCTRF